MCYGAAVCAPRGSHSPHCPQAEMNTWGLCAPCPQCRPAYTGAHVCLALVLSRGRKTHPSKQDCHLLHP